MATRIARAAEITGNRAHHCCRVSTRTAHLWSRTTCRPAPVHLLDRPIAKLIAATQIAVRALPGANIGVAPHSLRAVTPERTGGNRATGRSRADSYPRREQIKEVEECLAWSGRRRLSGLLDHAPIDQRWCLIHATHATAAEIASLANSGAVAGLCPVTEASLGDGIFRPRILTARGPVRRRHRFAGRKNAVAEARLW